MMGIDLILIIPPDIIHGVKRCFFFFGKGSRICLDEKDRCDALLHCSERVFNPAKFMINAL